MMGKIVLVCTLGTLSMVFASMENPELDRALNKMESAGRSAREALNAEQLSNLEEFEAKITDIIGVDLDHPYTIVSDAAFETSLMEFMSEKSGHYSPEQENGALKFRDDYHHLLKNSCDSIKDYYKATQARYQLLKGGIVGFSNMIKERPELERWVKMSGLCQLIEEKNDNAIEQIYDNMIAYKKAIPVYGGSSNNTTSITTDV